MSKPTRYDAADLRCKKCQKNVDFFGVLRSHDEGRFVMWDDYAALQAENEKYRRVFQGEAGWTLVEPNHLAALQAENERLRNAGDALDAYLKRLDGTTNGMLDCRRQWLDAKEVHP